MHTIDLFVKIVAVCLLVKHCVHFISELKKEDNFRQLWCHSGFGVGGALQ